MSRRTRSVAVAVYAWTAAPGKISLSRLSLAIILPKIVPPMADAMGLIHRKRTDAGFPQQPLEAGQGQSFRRSK